MGAQTPKNLTAIPTLLRWKKKNKTKQQPGWGSLTPAWHLWERLRRAGASFAPSLDLQQITQPPVSDRQRVNSTYLSEGRSSVNAIINHREATINYYHKTKACSFYFPRSIFLKGLPVLGLSCRQRTRTIINTRQLVNKGQVVSPAFQDTETGEEWI